MDQSFTNIKAEAALRAVGTLSAAILQNPGGRHSHTGTRAVPIRNDFPAFVSRLQYLQADFRSSTANRRRNDSSEPIAAPRRLVAVRGGRAQPARTKERMQELVLIQPGRAAETEWAREAASAATRREFEERLAECGPLAFRIARGVLRNTADAEDVAQESLLRAYRRFDRLRDRQRFRAWLVRITFRLALDRARSAKRREQRETLWAQPVPRPTTEDLAASSEFQAHLARALDELSPKLRLVLLLAAMEGHTLDEVAELLSLPVGTVKSRLFVARKQLAEKLRCHVKNTKTR